MRKLFVTFIPSKVSWSVGLIILAVIFGGVAAYFIVQRPWLFDFLLHGGLLNVGSFVFFLRNFIPIVLFAGLAVWFFLLARPNKKKMEKNKQIIEEAQAKLEERTAQLKALETDPDSLQEKAEPVDKELEEWMELEALENGARLSHQ